MSVENFMTKSIVSIPDPDPDVAYWYEAVISDIIILPFYRCNGFTKLMASILRKQTPDAFDNVNSQNDDGFTALMFACYTSMKNCVEVVKKLIESGADINIQNKHGYTALMLATLSLNSNSAEIIDVLIDAGADVNIKNNKNDTALILYLKTGRVVKETLLKLMIKSKNVITDLNGLSISAFDYYQSKSLNILNEEEIQILKGERYVTKTKSARF